MNVFVLDSSPKQAAKYHCDRHVIKMILESAQLLCTAHRVLDGKRNGRVWVHPDQELDRILYSATHMNHPCAIWVRESSQNYYWVYQLMLELNNEFVRRYNKPEDHTTIKKLAKPLEIAPRHMLDIGATFPPKCMPEALRLQDVVEAYRLYYRKEKREIAKWTNTPVPEWFQNPD